MNNNGLIKLESNAADNETGLVIQNVYVANSGFHYMNGLREFENLKIIEGVSKGTASIFLTSLMVLDKNGKLIFDGHIKGRTNYSRETVRQLVLNGLMVMLREAAERDNKCFDEIEVYEMLDNKLKGAYYEESYKSVLDWAKEIGVSFF